MTPDADILIRRRGSGVQLAIFPVWLGAALVLGLPDHAILYPRLISFGINLVTIAAAGVGAYAILHLGSGRGWGSPRGVRAAQL